MDKEQSHLRCPEDRNNDSKSRLSWLELRRDISIRQMVTEHLGEATV